MSFNSIGDLSASIRLRTLNAGLKQRAAVLGRELSTGRVSDTSKHLSGALDHYASISRSHRMTEAYQSNLAHMRTKGTVVQTALGVLQSNAEQTSAKILTAAVTETKSATDAVGALAMESLKSALGALNIQAAGQSLFAGQAVRSPAVADADTIIAELSALVSGETAPVQVSMIVDTYFSASGGGYETSTYLGSDTVAGDLQISESSKASFKVSAATPEIRDALAALATAALTTTDLFGGDQAARSQLLKSSGEALISASEGIIAVRAEIGAIEQRIEQVSVSNLAARISLEIQKNDLVSADGFETATNLQSVEASLEALYITTARLSQLSLTNFLR